MAEPPILALADVALTFGGDPLFKGATFTVQQGERIALVGRNGSGKSTLLKLMAGRVEPDAGTRFVQPRVSIGYMAQDPDFAGFATLGTFAAEGVDPDAHWRVGMAMDGLRLDPTLPPAAASGGERRRAALARLVAEAPELMLLDEPTNHLDIAAIAWLEAHLTQTRSAFVAVSHDRAFLRRLTDGLLWIDRGEVRRLDRGFAAFEAWRDELYAEEDAARHKLGRLIEAEGRWAVEGISARRRRNQGRVRRLEELRAGRRAEIPRQGTARMALEAGPRSGRMVIEAEHLHKALGGRVLVRDFTIRVRRGERVAFVGPNGVGKTTLLKLLTERLAPDGGTVRLGAGLHPAFFDQNREALDPDATLWATLTGDAELGLAGANDQVMVRGRPRHVVGYLKEFLFAEAQARGPVSALSGGEKARLLLATLMARDTNLLVLDEPTNDLDIETLDLLQELIADYAGTVLIVSHDRDFIDRTATATVVMDGGGRAVVHAGGWSDTLGRQAAEPREPAAPTPRPAGGSRPTARPPRFRFVDAHRLAVLPGEIDRLVANIARLEGLLADPDLFARDPARFAKASAALAARQATLAAVEEEWLALEELREASAAEGGAASPRVGGG